MTMQASAVPPPDPRQGGHGFPDGMEPDAVLASVKSLLAVWAVEDTQRLEALAQAWLQPRGTRSGQGAASVLPYLIAMVKGQH